MTPSSPAAPASDSPGCLSYLLLAFAMAWVLVVAISVQVAGWFADQILMIEGLPMLGGWWVLRRTIFASRTRRRFGWRIR